jgi:hypothetical protein
MKYKLEEVRYALVVARRQGVTSLADFEGRSGVGARAARVEGRMKERELPLLRQAVGFPCFAIGRPSTSTWMRRRPRRAAHSGPAENSTSAPRAAAAMTISPALVPTRRQQRTARIFARDLARIVRGGAAATVRPAKALARGFFNLQRTRARDGGRAARR